MSGQNDETWKASDVSDNEVTNPEMSKSMYLSESEDTSSSKPVLSDVTSIESEQDNSDVSESREEDDQEDSEENEETGDEEDNDDEEDEEDSEENEEDNDDESNESDEEDEGEYVSENEEDNDKEYDIKRTNNIIILKIPVENLKEPEFPSIITGVALALCAVWMFRVITLLCTLMNDNCKTCRPICN